MSFCVCFPSLNGKFVHVVAHTSFIPLLLCNIPLHEDSAAYVLLMDVGLFLVSPLPSVLTSISRSLWKGILEISKNDTHRQVNLFQTGSKMHSLLYKRVFYILNEGTVLGLLPLTVKPAPCFLIPFTTELWGRETASSSCLL